MCKGDGNLDVVNIQMAFKPLDASTAGGGHIDGDEKGSKDRPSVTPVFGHQEGRKETAKDLEGEATKIGRKPDEFGV